MSIPMSIETLRLLKDTTHDNIRKYCSENNRDFTEVKCQLYNMVDPYNVMLPCDFMIQAYNKSLKIQELIH